MQRSRVRVPFAPLHFNTAKQVGQATFFCLCVVLLAAPSETKKNLQKSLKSFGAMPFSVPRSAYIHVPFCTHRCGYCNFAVVAGREDLVGAYLQALGTELAWLEQPREVDTLYFGGGTPTFLAPKQLEQLCQATLRWHLLAEGYEWTVEANPGDLDPQRIEVLASLGVNRLSIGAQSFRAEKLTLLERDHARSDIHRAVELARAAGMRVSLDLIFASPGETLPQWTADLEEALALAPEHLSTYGLTFEQGTTFWNRLHKQELTTVAEELERDMYLTAIDRLAAANFSHYEISNFAQPGQQSRHNEVYWSGDGYYAAGPGAARYVDGVRETNHRSTSTYLKRISQGLSPVADREQLDAEARAREQLIFGLRRLAGVQRQAFFDRTGFEIDALVGESIAQFVELDLLQESNGRIRLTRAGLLVSDSLWPALL